MFCVSVQTIDYVTFLLGILYTKDLGDVHGEKRNSGTWASTSVTSILRLIIALLLRVLHPSCLLRGNIFSRFIKSFSFFTDERDEISCRIQNVTLTQSFHEIFIQVGFFLRLSWPWLRGGGGGRTFVWTGSYTLRTLTMPVVLVPFRLLDSVGSPRTPRYYWLTLHHRTYPSSRPFPAIHFWFLSSEGL